MQVKCDFCKESNIFFPLVSHSASLCHVLYRNDIAKEKISFYIKLHVVFLKCKCIKIDQFLKRLYETIGVVKIILVKALESLN